MDHLSPDTRACIEACQACHATCLSMAMTHCLELGGKYVAPAHFRLMLACAEFCRTSAAMMLLGTDLHRRSCRLCAEICDRCAASCEAVGDMEACVAQCRRCAEQCRTMAG